MFLFSSVAGAAVSAAGAAVQLLPLQLLLELQFSCICFFVRTSIRKSFNNSSCY
jgi:hypothetical protein